MKNTFPPWPSYTEDEVEAVSEVLRSGKVNQWTGNQITSFEVEYAEYFGCKHAVALANGTLALDIALRVLDIGAGDEVIVTPRSFVASASSIALAGARPVFVDIDRDTQNICDNNIRDAISPKTKAILVVHLAGMPANMTEIMKTAREFDLKVIEDCAQAHGAKWEGQHVGTIGDLGTWSFCQDKILTTGGEGGMVTTNNSKLWEQIWSFKDHGKNYDAMHASNQDNINYKWVHDTIGTNARMTEMQAAIGRIQLSKLDEWHSKRLKNATRIWEACRQIDWLRVPELDLRATHAAYKCYVFVDTAKLDPKFDRNFILNMLKKKSIPALQGSCSELYKEKSFSDENCRKVGKLTTCKELGDTSIMFMVHPTLRNEHIDYIAAALNEVDKHVSEAVHLSV